MSQTPSETALNIAVLLDRDPVMAAMLKCYLTESRLLELLELPELGQTLAEGERLKEIVKTFRAPVESFCQMVDTVNL